MCIAIVLPAGRPIEDGILKRCWDSNSHGAGFAYSVNGKIQVNKGHMTFDSFLHQFRRVRKKNMDKNMLVHFRIVSMGAKDKDRTHPFLFKHGAMIHNGTMQGSGARHGDGPSDTEMFVTKFGDRLTYDVVHSNKKELGEAIDSYNKLAFLYPDNRYVIINEHSGVWHQDVWFSNKHSFATPITSVSK